MVNPLIATYIYLPGNFNEVDLFKKYPVANYKFRRKFNRLELFYIMSRIIEVPFFNRSTRDNEGFIKLKAEYLQKAVPNYNDYLDYLVKSEIIKINKQYVPGEKVRGYVYCEPYLSSSDLIEIPIKSTDKIYKHLAEREREFSISDEAKKSFPYLTKWINNKLTLQFAKANKLIALIHELRLLEKERVVKATYKLLLESVKAYDSKELSRKEREAFYNAIRPVYEYRLGLITFRWQRWYANVDATVHRFHSNLTNLKSELRSCLRYDGKDLVSIDISNCQPYLLIMLLNPAFYSSESIAEEDYAKVNNNSSSILLSLLTITPSPKYTIQTFPSIYNHLPNNPIIMILKSEKLAEVLRKDDVVASLTDYIRHSVEGTLYEYISGKLRENGIPMPGERKDIKVMIFEILFTSNKYHSEKKKAFAQIFPFVNMVIEAIKLKHNRYLPILLQQIESRIFLNGISKRISEEKPGLPIYTVHDSIITLKGEEGYVKNIILEECQKVVGISPTIQIEDYSDHAAQGLIDKLEATINT